jgi:hypothetical protein
MTKRRLLSPTGPRSDHWGGARILFYNNCALGNVTYASCTISGPRRLYLYIRLIYNCTLNNFIMGFIMIQEYLSMTESYLYSSQLHIALVLIQRYTYISVLKVTHIL